MGRDRRPRGGQGARASAGRARRGPAAPRAARESRRAPVRWVVTPVAMLTITFSAVQLSAPLGRGHVPDRHKNAKPKYTADREIPGAFEGETVTRRRFMDVVATRRRRGRRGGVHPSRARLRARRRCSAASRSTGSRSVRSTTSPTNTYVTKVITIVPGIGEAGKTIAYVRKRNPAIDTEPEDQYNQFVALSTRCMHLGCPVRYVAGRRSGSSARATAASTTSAAWSPAARRCARSTASTPA